LLLKEKAQPSKVVGFVNFAEFFVTLYKTMTLMILIGPEQFNWIAILGLVMGGAICAPIAAWGCRRIPHRVLGTLVGTAIIILSTRHGTQILRASVTAKFTTYDGLNRKRSIEDCSVECCTQK